MKRSHIIGPTLGLTTWCLFMAAGTVLLAQHTVRPRDTAEGARLYQSTCILCHGPDGRRVAGTNLESGVFRHAKSDEDLVRVIREGIKNTGMPANKLSESEAANIVAYLHSMGAPAAPESVPAEVVRGKALFERIGCLECHRIHNAGGTASPGLRGPELGGIGRIRKPADIARSIVDPDAEVLYSYRMFRATTRRGATITGRALNEDTFTVQILDSDGRLRSLLKSDLRGYEFLAQSPMPSSRDKLTPAELADLVAYLASL